MSIDVTLSGITYPIPEYNDTGWAQGSGNLTQYLVAVAANIASTPSFMQTVAVSSTPVTMVSGKTYMVASNSLAVTLQLPTPVVNTWFFVKDTGGNSETNNITIARAGSETIDGMSANMTLQANYGSWGFFSDGTNWFLMVTT